MMTRTMDWKRFSYSFIASLMFVTVGGLSLSFLLFPVNPYPEMVKHMVQELLSPQRNTSITIAYAGGPWAWLPYPYSLPFWALLIGIIGFIVLFTVVFYGMFRWYDKRKQKKMIPQQ
jgi:hypothetical protein